MISFLKNSAFRRVLLFRPEFRFADSSLEHIERNKAILASQIITTIENSPFNHYRSGQPYPSLREKILQQIDCYNIDASSIPEPEQQRIGSAVRYALRRYFVNGVWVPYDMCSSTKFKDEPCKTYAELKDLNEEVEIQVDDKDEDLDLKFRKLKFCPTYFITGQIFQRIFSKPNMESVLMGKS